MSSDLSTNSREPLSRDDAVSDAAGGRIIIIDERTLLAESLARALETRRMSVRVLTRANIEQVTRETTAFAPDAVLVGDHPARVELITRLADLHTTSVVLVDGDDRIATAECVFVGASGVIEMGSGFESLAAQLGHAVAGNRVLPVDVERDLISDLLDHRRRSSDDHTPFERLTRREGQILGELMRGASASDIAATAYLSIATVRSHIQQILRKLDVRSQTSAVALAYRSGWQPPHEKKRPSTTSRAAPSR